MLLYKNISSHFEVEHLRSTEWHLGHPESFSRADKDSEMFII